MCEVFWSTWGPRAREELARFQDSGIRIRDKNKTRETLTLTAAAGGRETERGSKIRRAVPVEVDNSLTYPHSLFHCIFAFELYYW